MAADFSTKQKHDGGSLGPYLQPLTHSVLERHRGWWSAAALRPLHRRRPPHKEKENKKERERGKKTRWPDKQTERVFEICPYLLSLGVKRLGLSNPMFPTASEPLRCLFIPSLSLEGVPLYFNCARAKSMGDVLNGRLWSPSADIWGMHSGIFKCNEPHPPASKAEPNPLIMEKPDLTALDLETHNLSYWGKGTKACNHEQNDKEWTSFETLASKRKEKKRLSYQP